jgi:hypothetical protein
MSCTLSVLHSQKETQAINHSHFSTLTHTHTHTLSKAVLPLVEESLDLLLVNVVVCA